MVAYFIFFFLKKKRGGWISLAYRFRRANELQRGCGPIPTRPCVDACDSIGRSRKLLCALVVLINKCAAQALPPNRCTIKHQKRQQPRSNPAKEAAA